MQYEFLVNGEPVVLHLERNKPRPAIPGGKRTGKEGRKTMGRFIFLTLGLLVVAVSLNDALEEAENVSDHTQSEWEVVTGDPGLLATQGEEDPGLFAPNKSVIWRQRDARPNRHFGTEGNCGCHYDWFPLNGFHYRLFNIPTNWNDAEMFCRKYKPGCHLASIHGSEESIELAEYISDYIRSNGNVWIGLNDPEKKRSWHWTDRSSNCHLLWKTGEPNNYENKEYCVEILKDTGYKQWNDLDCKNARVFLCKCKF